MTEETAMTIPDDARAAFMAFDDDYLADVLRLWDCDLKRWHDPCMIVFRFEHEDIMVWNENGTIKYRLGSVDTNSTERALLSMVNASVVRDTCLCWLRDDRCAANVGATGTAAFCLTMIARPY